VNLAHTLPAPTDLQAQVTSRGIVLTWTSTVPSIIPAGTHYVYRVYRRLDGSSEQSLASEIPAEPGMSLTPTDSNIEWERTYEYHAEAVTVIDQPGRPSLQIEGDDSAEIKVFADDVFPPAVPSGLQAVFSGPGQKPFIDLIWAPVSDVDLAGYNVYRHEEGAVPVKVNAELVKTPAYRDADVASGKRYVYSVAAVDLRGNESARSSEANESVP
jgi:hypothetical protein